MSDKTKCKWEVNSNGDLLCRFSLERRAQIVLPAERFPISAEVAAQLINEAFAQGMEAKREQIYGCLVK